MEMGKLTPEQQSMIALICTDCLEANNPDLNDIFWGLIDLVKSGEIYVVYDDADGKVKYGAVMEG